MGFRFRKSINVGGGFRVNLSKSGIGYSFGTKGARITKTARGTKRTTLSLPGTGISYVSETGKKKKTASRPQQSSTLTSTQRRYSGAPEGTLKDTKGRASDMNSFLGLLKKVVLWVLSIFILLCGLVFFPSASSFCAIAAVALILPIQKWQNILGKLIKGKLKTILAIVFAVAMFACVPTTTENESSNTLPNTQPTITANTIAENANQTTATPTVIPTSTPTSSPIPTATPSQEPTATPTATPYVTPTPIPLLKERSSGQAVIDLQERLIELGYLDGEADGEFGSGTKKAVIEFQKNNNLSADGVAGENTQTILYSDNAVRQRWVWIPTNGGTKYHKNSGCSSMENPKRVPYREAIELGYDSCGRCY